MVQLESEKDFYAIDLLWSLFISALNSYRYDSVLRPFPQQYMDSTTDEKDITQLQAVSSEIQSVSQVLLKKETLHAKAFDLFQWVTEPTNFRLVRKSRSEFEAIKKLTKQVISAADPTHVFEVIHSDIREQRFQKYKKGYDTIFAYHGSRLENFHSILRNGLVSLLSKNGAFGSGTYFSSELSVSLHYSFKSQGWVNSIIGPQLSVVAVCEIIKDPLLEWDNRGNCQAVLEDSLYGNIPEKYFVVSNNDLVQLRYLLVYSFGRNEKRRTGVQWWRKHIFAIFLILYVVIMIVIMLL